MCSTPATRFSVSSTINTVIRCFSIRCTASGGELLGADLLAARGHDAGDRRGPDIEIGIEHAAQIAVGEDAERPIIGIDHRRHAEALAGHFQQGGGQRGVRTDLGNLLAGVHQIADFQQQPPAERAARMAQREILRREAARFQQGHGQRIAHCQGYGGRSGRREVQRAGFLFDRDIQMHIGRFRQR